jgi:hypothetical protein
MIRYGDKTEYRPVWTSVARHGRVYPSMGKYGRIYMNMGEYEYSRV